MSEMMLNAQETAYQVGVSVQTLGSWYKFKSENPENEFSKKLPDICRKGARNTRYWKESDIPLLQDFRKALPTGRNGVLGSVTQRYVKKRSRLPVPGACAARVAGIMREYQMDEATIHKVISILEESDNDRM